MSIGIMNSIVEKLFGFIMAVKMGMVTGELRSGIQN